ncbi:hypothetical protein [Luethyella okanaganae]|uniref:tRNA synthetases class I catalytic domain-containing protein n=1 Tax=Luethyella okanaganae TaxID=69372 RepID=A0ABW1VCS1_9MICO
MKLYNSQYHVIEEPSFGKDISIYNCGYSPIEPLHLGNTRPFVVVDQLRHLLETTHGASVRLVQDISDVDVRVDSRAAELSVSSGELRDRLVASFSTDLAGIAVSRPTVGPRTSEHVEGAIELISNLFSLGFAREQNGEVYLAASAPREGVDFRQLDPEQKVREMMCFSGQLWDYSKEILLWQPRPERHPRWSSPWGWGAPSENVPCVVLAHEYIGSTMDIHVGGIDLYPHHEIEMVLGELSTGVTYARTWIHSGVVETDGVRMANSKGNTIPLRAAINTYGAGAVRLLYLSTHYRDTLNASHAALIAAHQRFARLAKMCGPILAKSSRTSERLELTSEVAHLLDQDMAAESAVSSIERTVQQRSELSAADLRGALSLVKLDTLIERFG